MFAERKHSHLIAGTLLLCLFRTAQVRAALPWTSPDHYRILLKVDGSEIARSNSPASVDIDFTKALAKRNNHDRFDENTIEGERSGQIQTVCAASHSRSRT